MKFKKHLWCVLLLSVLAACASDDASRIAPEPEPPVMEPVELVTVDAEPAPAPTYSIPSREVVRAMVIADILYEARKALEDNRLMQPASDNAYDYYFQVLSFDPENEVAIAGIEEIGLRYVALANNATRIGQYDQAETYLRRAASINDQSDELLQARRELSEARQTERKAFELDPQALSERSLELMVELGDIGNYLVQEEGTFLIIARTDEEGRWIYRIMREAVGGQRLRGNIAIGSRPEIQVTLPEHRPDLAGAGDEKECEGNQC